MLRGRLKFLLVAAFLCGSRLYAEDNRLTDSLKNALSRAEKVEDSIRILCQLCWNNNNTKPEDIHAYGIKVLPLAERTTDHHLSSEAYDAAALGYWLTGDYEQAEILYHKSLSIGEKYRFHDRIAWCNYNLAQINFINHRINKALKYIESSHHAFHLAGMDYWMIRSYWLHAKMLSGDTKRELYEKMITVIGELISSNPGPELEMYCYVDMANLYKLTGNHALSLEYILRALETSQKHNYEKGILTAYTSIGDYLRDIQHNYQVALKYYERTLERYEEYNNSWGKAEIMIDIGSVYKEMQNDSLAFHYYTQAIETAGVINAEYLSAAAYNLMGEIYFRNKDYRQAMELFRKSFQSTSSSVDERHKACINLGNVYAKMGYNKKARIFYERSLAIADSVDDSQLKSISHLNYGSWLLGINDLYNAEKQLLDAKQISRLSGSLSLQIKVTQELGSLYLVRNDFRKAYQVQNEMISLEDSLRKMNESHNLAQLENLFEIENLRMQKEMDRTLTDAKIQRHKLARNFFIAGFILMTLIGIYLYLNIKRKKKDNLLLSEQKKQIQEMSEKVHEVDEMKLQFFTGISHELRTPLTLITGLTDQLSQSDYNEKTWREKLEIIQKNAGRLHYLVNQILDIRKLDNAGSSFNLVKDDMITYLSGVVSSFREYAKRRNTELIFVSEKPSLVVEYDYDKLHKIISNLLSNSVKFCGENDKIRVTFYMSGDDKDYCTIEVNDTGKGIPSDELKYIFQPFYQASNAMGGSGLGLALVRELVRLLKGEINVRSEEGKGTSIVLKLPLALKTVVGKESVTETTAQNRTTVIDEEYPCLNPDSNTGEEVLSNTEEDERKLLIVEDNEDLCNFIAGIMKDEFRIYTAENGRKGFEIATAVIPDVIISDIMMPVMDGIRLCELLKETFCTSHIPVLMLTAKTDQESMLNSYKKGADDYIIKPFNAVVLKSRVHNLIEQRRKLISKFSRQFKIEPTKLTLPDADKLFLEKTIRVIEDNISEPCLDINFLASEMLVSRTQLYRKLKALTDMSGNQFIRLIRLKRAAQLLSESKMTIAEIMQETGFSNYSHFNACFREEFKKSPKEYAMIKNGN